MEINIPFFLIPHVYTNILVCFPAKNLIFFFLGLAII